MTASDGDGTVVRNATENDWPTVLDFGRRLHSESLWRVLPFDEDKAIALLRWYARTPATSCFLIAERKGEVAGFLMAYMGDLAFSYERRAINGFYYVVPDQRGSLAGLRLLRHFKAWARKHGAFEVQIGMSGGINTDRMIRFLEHLGFRHTGDIFLSW